MVSQLNQKADSAKRRNIALPEVPKMGIEGYHGHDTPQCESVDLEQSLTAWKHELEYIYRLKPSEQGKFLEYLIPYALTILPESGPEAEEVREMLKNWVLKLRTEGSLSEPVPSTHDAILPKQIWQAALAELQILVSRSNYTTWLAKTTGLGYERDQFVIGVPNSFVAEYLDKNQRSLIEKVLSGITGQEVQVRFSTLPEDHLETARRPFKGEFHPPLKTKEAIDGYLAHMDDEGAAEGYITVRARKLRFFARQYPKLPTDPEVIRGYLRQFRTRDVPTRQDHWKALSALYKFASDTYGIPDPFLNNKVEKPRFKKKPGKRLSHDEARAFLTAVRTDLEWAIVTCYFGLRFRRIEAERLPSEAIRSDIITVDGKERSEELPLPPVFRDMLLRIENHGPNGRHFPLKGDGMAYHIRQIGKRVNLRVAPHILRNTAAALWYYYGGDKESNRMLLRHGTDDMTDHYSNEFLEELRIKDERHNPMLNLMRELVAESALTNTTGVRETEPKRQIEDITSVMGYLTHPTTSPARQLPELLDQMIALGRRAEEFKHALGGNGHWPEQTEEIIKYLQHQASE